MKMTELGWGYLRDRASEKRKEELKIYADKYITPMLDTFPELYGKVF